MLKLPLLGTVPEASQFCDFISDGDHHRHTHETPAPHSGPFYSLANSVLASSRPCT